MKWVDASNNNFSQLYRISSFADYYELVSNTVNLPDEIRSRPAIPMLSFLTLSGEPEFLSCLHNLEIQKCIELLIIQFSTSIVR